MTSEDWRDILRDLHQVDDLERFVAANEKIHKASVQEDLPRLMELLNDPEFTVREAAAWPISELAGLAALPQLLVAYQRGLDDGHDNDGFSAALIDMVATDPVAAREALESILRSADATMASNAKWLLDWCEEQISS